MDPIPLNAVRAAAADVAADTSGTAVAAPVADIAGAAANTAVAAADAWAAALADAAADVAAIVDSAGDLYRHAYRVCRHCGLHVPRSARRFWL